MIMIMRAATRERGKVERRQAGGRTGNRQGWEKLGREGGPPPSKAEIPVYCSKPTPVNHQTLESCRRRSRTSNPLTYMSNGTMPQQYSSILAWKCRPNMMETGFHTNAPVAAQIQYSSSETEAGRGEEWTARRLVIPLVMANQGSVG